MLKKSEALCDSESHMPESFVLEETLLRGSSGSSLHLITICCILSREVLTFFQQGISTPNFLLTHPIASTEKGKKNLTDSIES